MVSSGCSPEGTQALLPQAGSQAQAEPYTVEESRGLCSGCMWATTCRSGTSIEDSKSYLTVLLLLLRVLHVSGSKGDPSPEPISVTLCLLPSNSLCASHICCQGGCSSWLVSDKAPECFARRGKCTMKARGFSQHTQQPVQIYMVLSFLT